jgi:3-deoxy-D-manno-octulosonic-acid transferase
MGFGERLPKSDHRVWIHGASVGEMMAMRPIADRFHAKCPEAPVVVSTVTPTGQEVARKSFAWAEQVRYFPLDMPGPVARSISGVGARVHALAETELWPNFLHAAARRGPVVLLNGRISDRTFQNAQRILPAYRWMVGHLSIVAMQTQADADRITELGADPSRVRVLGTSKFDEPVPQMDAAALREWRRRLGLRDDRVAIAGSIFPGEDEAVLNAFIASRARIPSLRLLIAPRHVERAPDIHALALSAGLKPGFRSANLDGDEDVIVIDTYGELAELYALAEVAFVGKSLGTEEGGQNLIQPMAHGVPVVHGPNMQNFRDVAARAEEVGASRVVQDAAALADAWTSLLASEVKRRGMGEAGRALVESNRGAADAYADVLREALKGCPPG